MNQVANAPFWQVASSCQSLRAFFFLGKFSLSSGRLSPLPGVIKAIGFLGPAGKGHWGISLFRMQAFCECPCSPVSISTLPSVSGVVSPDPRERASLVSLFPFPKGWKWEVVRIWMFSAPMETSDYFTCQQGCPYLHFLWCPQSLGLSAASQWIPSAQTGARRLCALCSTEWIILLPFCFLSSKKFAVFLLLLISFCCFLLFCRTWEGVTNKNSLFGLFLKPKDKLWL